MVADDARLAEGVGFEPTDGLPHLLISSQVPLTTQPPFQPSNDQDVRREKNPQLDRLMLRSDTDRVKGQEQEPASPATSKAWQKTPYASLVRCVPSGAYFARIRVGGKLIRQGLTTKVRSVAKPRLADVEKRERSNLEAHTSLVASDATVRDLVKLWRERMEAEHPVKPRTRT